MSKPVPTIGRIVQYTLSVQDAEAINRRRLDAANHGRGRTPNGDQVHVGNNAYARDVYPMLIVRTWGTAPESAVNGQVFLDGNDTFWATSVSEGEGERHYQWPNVPQKAAE